MQRTYLIMAFLSLGLLGMLPSAHAQVPMPQIPCTIVSTAGAPTPGVSPCASEADIQSLSQAIANLGDSITAGFTALGTTITANGAVDDARANNLKAESHNIASGLQTGTQMMQFIKDHPHNYDICTHMTNNVMLGVSRQALRMDPTLQGLANPMVKGSDANNILNGPPGGATAFRQAYAKNVQQALADMVNGKNSDDGKDPNTGKTIGINDNQLGTFNPDMGQVKMFCQTPACYNTSLLNLLTGALVESTPDRAPVNAGSNPQIANYFLQRAAWGADRSEARDTALKLLPKMDKNIDLYTQALKSLGVANSQDLTNATVKEIIYEYPNANKIGLSEYEFLEIEFAAITNPGQFQSNIAHEVTITVNQGAADRQYAAQTIQAQAASLQIAKMERDQFDNSLRIIRSSQAPALNASALGTTTQ